jgi:hypothetical protein
MNLTVKHERGESERRKPGKSMAVRIGPALCIVFALVAIGFGVYELVHTEVSKGSLSILLGIVILNFALHWMGVFGN